MIIIQRIQNVYLLHQRIKNNCRLQFLKAHKTAQEFNIYYINFTFIRNIKISTSMNKIIQKRNRKQCLTETTVYSIRL